MWHLSWYLILQLSTEIVPTLCLGNLDFDTRDSIIQSVLHYELDLKYYLKAYISKKGFMLQVTSFRAFEELSKLLVKRLLYPLVPEINLLTRRIWYKYDEAHRIYYAESAIFHKNYLGNENVIGAESEIDKECKMNNTVVGERCIIRGDVTICDSFLMDDVTIGNGCVVKNCFLGNNVKLFPGVNLDYGVIMGPNTKLGPSVKVYPYRRLVCSPPEVECKKEEFFMPFIPGSKGQAFEVTVDDGIKPQKDLDGFGFEDLKWGEYPQVRECLPIITDNKFDKIEDLEPHLALDFSSDEDKEKEFGEKVMNTLLNAYKDGSSLRPIMLELHTSFHTYNITEENVLRVMVKTILHVVEKAQSDRESREVVNKLECVGKGLLYFEDFIRKYVKNLKHQIIILNLLEELADEEPQYITIMQDIIQQLNQELEILDDEVIIYWYRNGGHKTSKFPIIAKKIKKHVEWLEDVSEEEDNIE
ncbi:Translation initiation factor eIF-2B subunit gamma [Armadillidium vulgare]|nr:Translation initiation factor eIF-2B subunit gamma [Armadillidium vulgare]